MVFKAFCIFLPWTENSLCIERVRSDKLVFWGWRKAEYKRKTLCQNSKSVLTFSCLKQDSNEPGFTTAIETECTVFMYSACDRLTMGATPQPFQCYSYFCQKHKDANIFEKNLNPVMLVLIG